MHIWYLKPLDLPMSKGVSVGKKRLADEGMKLGVLQHQSRRSEKQLTVLSGRKEAGKYDILEMKKCFANERGKLGQMLLPDF